jgi:DNA-binding NtrC family response regulator
MTQPAEALAANILIVDDNPANLDVLGRVLESQGHRVMAASGGELALRVAAAERPELVLLDVVMPGLDGYETCRRLKADPLTADLPVLFISARDATESLVLGFEAGGVDYLTKPFRDEEVLARVRAHLQIARLTREMRVKNEALAASNEALRREAQRRETAEDALQTADQQLSVLSDRESERWGIGGFVGRSKTIRRILQDIRRVQNFGSVNVVITGESGTGKELVARAIHFGSTRSAGPFIPVNCVAIPEDLAESMLFGHVRGAFTGATMDRKGFFELAHGGTLFLDEIGDMPVSLQAKLLRVLEDGRVMPLGSSREKQVDVRIVAATNADLSAQIEGGAFRQDLYFRLAQFSVEVPPLRTRREDIPLLAAHFVHLFSREMGIPAPQVGADLLGALEAHEFPGNVRELKNVIERALIESGGADLKAEHLRLGPRRLTGKVPHSQAAGPAGVAAEPPLGVADLPLNLEEAENLLIRRALAETGGNIAEAARRLGINRTRIYRKIADRVERT